MHKTVHFTGTELTLLARSGFSDQSPTRQKQCWIPVVANHFLATSPFVNSPQALLPIAGPTTPPELVPVPVIVPTLPPPPAASRPARRPREVKFDESKVWRQLSGRRKRGSSFREKNDESTPETIPLFQFPPGS